MKAEDMYHVTSVIKGFPDNLVFVFNKHELAAKVNHFQGLSDQPNCAFAGKWTSEAGDDDSKFTTQFQLLWILPRPPKKGEQLLANYGAKYTYMEPWEHYEGTDDWDKPMNSEPIELDNALNNKPSSCATSTCPSPWSW